MAQRVVVLADDLIWQTRLTTTIEALGIGVIRAAGRAGFAAGLASADAVIVDLTARGYDGLEAIEAAAGRGLPVLAVAQHDDLPLRKRALAAGADRVFAYRKLFEDGPTTIAAWLAGAGVVAGAIGATRAES